MEDRKDVCTVYLVQERAGVGGGDGARGAGRASGVGQRARARHRATAARLRALRARLLRTLLCANR